MEELELDVNPSSRDTLGNRKCEGEYHSESIRRLICKMMVHHGVMICTTVQCSAERGWDGMG